MNKNRRKGRAVSNNSWKSIVREKKKSKEGKRVVAVVLPGSTVDTYGSHSDDYEWELRYSLTKD